MKILFTLLFIFFVGKLNCAEQIGDLDLIDFASLNSTNYFKEGLLVLVASELIQYIHHFLGVKAFYDILW